MKNCKHDYRMIGTPVVSTDKTYEFKCLNCGHKWSATS